MKRKTYEITGEVAQQKKYLQNYEIICRTFSVAICGFSDMVVFGSVSGVYERVVKELHRFAEQQSFFYVF